MSSVHQKVTASRLSRDAYLYVRQASLRQVFEHAGRGGECPLRTSSLHAEARRGEPPPFGREVEAFEVVGLG